MGRRNKKGRPISGWLVLDKPIGMGSTDAVSKLKWLFKAQKVGHAGTLDPLASGVLPIAFGEATKTVPFITNSEKLYQFTACWGVSTSTDDAEGDAIATSDFRPTIDDINSVLGDFTGEIDQVPPQYSAVKVGGERAYDIAREGEIVELAPRKIKIHELRVVDSSYSAETVFEAQTGKGAYVRALVRDIAKALGTEGHVTALRRVGVGPFNVDNTVKLEQIEASDPIEQRDAFLTPIAAALPNLPQAPVDGPQADKLRRGQAAIIAPPVAKGVRGEVVGEIEGVLAVLHDEAVAICTLDGLKLRPTRVLNL